MDKWLLHGSDNGLTEYLCIHIFCMLQLPPGHEKCTWPTYMTQDKWKSWPWIEFVVFFTMPNVMQDISDFDNFRALTSI